MNQRQACDKKGASETDKCANSDFSLARSANGKCSMTKHVLEKHRIRRQTADDKASALSDTQTNNWKWTMKIHHSHTFAKRKELQTIRAHAPVRIFLCHLYSRWIIHKCDVSKRISTVWKAHCSNFCQMLAANSSFFSSLAFLPLLHARFLFSEFSNKQKNRKRAKWQLNRIEIHWSKIIIKKINETIFLQKIIESIELSF